MRTQKNERRRIKAFKMSKEIIFLKYKTIKPKNKYMKIYEKMYINCFVI